MSAKPGRGKSGRGGGGKQRPQRPQRPQHRKPRKATMPVPPHGSAAHGAPAGKQHHHRQSGGHASKAGKTKRGFTEGVACCAAEALAASLRLQGWPVGDDDVLTLYRLTAAQPDDGAYIEHALEMAATHGLAGTRLLGYQEVMPSEILHTHPLGVRGAGLILGVDWPGQHTVYDDGHSWWSWGIEFEPWHAAIGEAWALRWELRAA